MSELDSEEEQILARTRRAFSPSDADAARVLRATSLALGLPVSGAVCANAAAHAGATASGGANAAASTGVAKLSPLTAAAGKWLAGLAVVCAAAGGGYVYGFRAGREVSQREAAAAVATTATPANATLKPTSAPPDPTRATPTPAIAVRSLSDSAHAASTAPAPATAPQPSAAAENAVTRDAPPARSLGAKPPVAASTQAHAQSLQAELRALRRVESSLREGKAELALRVLTQLDRDFPRGQMLEERAAAWALARCTGARSHEVANEFNQRHPGSVYAERVLAACDAPAANSFDNRAVAP
jgi:hypothetical protein